MSRTATIGFEAPVWPTIQCPWIVYLAFWAVEPTGEKMRSAAKGLAMALLVVPAILFADEIQQAVSTTQIVMPLSLVASMIAAAVSLAVGVLLFVHRFTTKMAIDYKTATDELAREHRESNDKLTREIGGLGTRIGELRLQIAEENAKKTDVDRLWEKMRDMDLRLTRTEERQQITGEFQVRPKVC